MYNTLWDLPGRYNACKHSLNALLGSYFRELYRSVKQVYENSIHYRLLSMAWETSVSSMGVVHLVYIALRYFAGKYNLGTHSIRALFASYFGELYRSVQQVYDNPVR